MANNMIVESNGALVEQMTKFEAVLNDWGLPSENIIASVEERQNIMEMLPGLIASIPDEQKKRCNLFIKICGRGCDWIV